MAFTVWSSYNTTEVVVGLVPSPTVLSTDEMGRIAPPIFASVGLNGQNAPGDVFVIQSLLNARLPGPHSPVPVANQSDMASIAGRNRAGSCRKRPSISKNCWPPPMS